MPPADSIAKQPADFHQTLMKPADQPGPENDLAPGAVWSENWGAYDEVGVLRKVLMRTPSQKLTQIREDAYKPELDALVDDGGDWYWTGSAPPEMRRVMEQHSGLARTLEQEGVEVIMCDPLESYWAKSMYTRDPLITVPGGAIIGRLSAAMRRGEESHVTKEVATLGLPILGTLTGGGTLEGGSFAKLRPGLAALGTSIRCNLEGARQLKAILALLGWELILVPLPGFVVHLDIHFAMVDTDRALVNAEGLPFDFLENLKELGIETIWAHPDEPWGMNLLTLSPGRVLTSTSAPRTAELLASKGVDVVTVEYDELHKNGGGIHCSTMELLRDPSV